MNDPLEWKKVSWEHACETHCGGFSLRRSCLQVQVLLNQQGARLTAIAAHFLVDQENASSQPRHIYRRNAYKKQDFDLNFPVAADREKYICKRRFRWQSPDSSKSKENVSLCS